VHDLSLTLKNKDKEVWNDSDSIEYFVSSAYNFLRGEEEGEVKRLYNYFWMINVLPSVHVTA